MPAVLKKFYLFPSMIFARKEGYMVETILGSCVSVCLYDEKLMIGGINHYMLPVWNGNGLATPRYGNIAIDKLIEKVNGLGATNLVAKVFGGASQLNSSLCIGEHNIRVAHEQLRLKGIKIIAENVGGNIGRKICFDTQSGKVQMKFISKAE